jgi:hypothetical protein
MSMIVRDATTDMKEDLQSGGWEVVLIPEELVVLNDTTDHVKDWLALEFTRQRVYP